MSNPYLKDQVFKTKSEVALIKGDVLTSGLQCNHMSNYTDFKRCKFEAKFKGDCKNQVKSKS